MELNESTVRVGYKTGPEPLNDDLVEVAMVFVECIDGRWEVNQIKWLIRAEPETVWHIKTECAQVYLDEETGASGYRQQISQTIEQTLILDEAATPSRTKTELASSSDVIEAKSSAQKRATRYRIYFSSASVPGSQFSVSISTTNFPFSPLSATFVLDVMSRHA